MGTLPGKLGVGGTVSDPTPPSHICLLEHTYIHAYVIHTTPTSTTFFKDRELAAQNWNHISHSSTQDWTDSAGGAPRLASPRPQFQQTTRNSLAPAALTAGTRSPPPQTPPPLYMNSTLSATARGDHCGGRILLLGNRGLPAVAVPTHSVSRFQSAGQCQHWVQQTG